jgi:WD40 repeat protein
MSEHPQEAATTPVAAGSASLPPPHVPDHELLRQIGGGSYGEVWLARNVMGTYRAVKIVYRRRFEHQRPYERELEGIEKFEPISRSHEGLVDVLQVGRNDAEGYFYYVMELADDASAECDVRSSESSGAEDEKEKGGKGEGEERRQGESERVGKWESGSDQSRPDAGAEDIGSAAPAAETRRTERAINQPASGIKPQTYIPKTLKREVYERGRLPFQECLELALSLTQAVGHLHKHGLLHRDIKPSNIIFVNGVPKLADIGLVAEVGATLSFVGTEGFIPPEGPGTAQADLYGLGKVLYEITTAKDRQAFPEPPSDLGALAHQEGFLELNEVIFKACAADPRKRYRTAEEMHDDLVLVQSGRSVRRLRAAEKRLAVATRIGAAACVLGALIAAGYFYQQRQAEAFKRLAAEETSQRQRAEQNQQRAEHNELLARRTLYASDMNLAIQALENDNLRRVHELLERHRPKAGEPDLRDWEWRYLWRQCQSDELFTLGSLDGSVAEVFFSRDGKAVGAADHGGRVKEWSLLTREERALPQLHNGWMSCAAYNPRSGLAAVGAGRTVRVRDLETGREEAVLKGHTDLVAKVAFSADGGHLASLDIDGNLFLWQLESERRVGATSFFEWHGTGRAALAFSPDGRTVAVGLDDGMIRLLGVPDLRARLSLAGHTEAVTTLAFSLDGQHLASSGWDQRIVIWRVGSGDRVATLPAHKFWVARVAFSSDGRWLASASADQTIRLWDTATWEQAVKLRGHLDEVHCLAFHPDGQSLVTGGKDGVVKQWSVPQSRHTGFTALRFPAEKFGARLAAEARLIVVPHYTNNLVEVWDANTYRRTQQLHLPVRNILSVAVTRDASILATGLSDATICLWRFPSGEHLATFPAVGAAYALAFSPDDQTLAAVDGGTLRLWSVATGQELLSVKVTRSEGSTGLAFSPDGKLLATGSDDAAARLWDITTGQCFATLRGAFLSVRSVAFSADGRRLQAGTAEGTIMLWDVRDRERPQLLGTLNGHDDFVHTVFFLDEDTLFSADRKGKTLLWRAAQFEETDAPRVTQPLEPAVW